MTNSQHERSSDMMTDPRVVLDQIRTRADNGMESDWDPRGGDEPHHRVIERSIRFDKQIRADARGLVAALRAVLDNHRCIEGGEECGYDGRHWPCPDHRAITTALETSWTGPGAAPVRLT